MPLGEEATREEEKKERDGLVSLRHLFQPYALLFLPPPPWMVKWASLFPPWNLLLNSPPLDLLRSASTHCRLMKIMIMIANTSSHLVLPFKLWISSIKSLSRQALSFYFFYTYIYCLLFSNNLI